VRYLFNPLSMPYGGAKRAAAAVPRARQTNPQLAQLQAEDLLDVLQRAGLAVWWLDNQSGCKRLCERVPQVLTGTLEDPVLCSGGERLDETMLKDPDRRIEALGATRLARGLVMHQMGSHGPAYFRRSLPALKRTTANRWGKQSLPHGLPHALAAGFQTHLPMATWVSPAMQTRLVLRAGCLRQKADAPLSHDHLFHSVLGLPDTNTTLHHSAPDIFAACR
jgi:lipid A ethanolaminephosphotransferase